MGGGWGHGATVYQISDSIWYAMVPKTGLSVLLFVFVCDVGRVIGCVCLSVYFRICQSAQEYPPGYG